MSPPFSRLVHRDAGETEDRHAPPAAGYPVTVPVPFHRVEAALLAALAEGPQLVCDLAAAIERPDAHGLVIAEAALRSMRARGLVRPEPGPDAVWRWAWVGVYGQGPGPPAAGAVDDQGDP